MMRTSEDLEDEIESVELTEGADPCKVLVIAKHITPLESLRLSVELGTLRCQYAETPLSCCVLRYANAGFINHSCIHHLCTCNFDPGVLVQGAEADETLPPSAETFSQSDKTDKTVQQSDKPGPPSPKAPRTRRLRRNQLSVRLPSHWGWYPLLLRNLRYSNTWFVCTSAQCLTPYSGDCHSLKHLACTT